MEDVKKDIRKFISTNLFAGAAAAEISDDQSFLDLGILDSTGVIELIAFLEETYGIRVEDEEIVPENLDSLGNIERYVYGKRPAANLHPASLPA